MPQSSHKPAQRIAVCEVHLEQLEHGLNNLHGYQQAFVVFRLRGVVIGQAWLTVDNGRIPAAKLRATLPAVAWPVWQQLAVESPAPRQPLPTASVVVCTRDRTPDMTLCLQTLSQFATQGYEVIVVDNCPSDDSTARLVSSYPAIRYLHEPRPGLDVARNRGLQAATGEIVACTDDDAQVDPGWLVALLRNFDDPMVAVVTGITLPLELETEAQQWFEWTNGFSRGFMRQQFDLTNFNPLAAGLVGAGVNMAIRRRALDHIGLFDEALDCGTPSCSGGDQEFFYRTLARGYRIVYEPAALVWHRHRRDWEALCRTFYSYGVGLFAWWTRTLLIEKELTLLKTAPGWFWQHHVRNLLRSLLQRPHCTPLDLALAEFRGALAGPGAYLRARRWRHQRQDITAGQEPIMVTSRPLPVAIDQVLASAAETVPAMAGSQNLEGL
jgi:glycosyltransferase involved in cell wall biosynthesis